MSRRWLAIPSVAFVLGAIGLSCMAPTEILLDVRTNIPCSGSAPWKGIAITVGQPGVDVESRAPVLTSKTCTAAGEVGTLVIVPSGSDTAAVGIRVVAGINANPEDCPTNGYAGCVVSRRTLTFLPHQTQNVVVDLTSDCIGNACDINHTCVAGSCTDTVTATAPVAPDGGVVSGPTVRCGDDGTRCPVNDPTNVCCVSFELDAGTGKGSCVASPACPSTSVVLYCDDSSECAPTDAGARRYCIITGFGGGIPSGSACTTFTGGQEALCGSRQICPVSGTICQQAHNAPGYFNCEAPAM